MCTAWILKWRKKKGTIAKCDQGDHRCQRNRDWYRSILHSCDPLPAYSVSRNHSSCTKHKNDNPNRWSSPSPDFCKSFAKLCILFVSSSVFLQLPVIEGSFLPLFRQTFLANFEFPTTDLRRTSASSPTIFTDLSFHCLFIELFNYHKPFFLSPGFYKTGP